MEEEWRTIEDFPMYEVSDHGRVYSHHMQACRKLNLNKGYLFLTVRDSDKKTYKLMVHLLVLTHFNKPRPTGLECNHIDGVKTNNHISNLEWVTQSENAKHAYAMGLSKPSGCAVMCWRGTKHSRTNLKYEDVHFIRERYKKGGITYTELGNMFGGLTKSTIYSIVKRKNWKHI